ncbi:hypothetical protein [Solimonas sp. SE-A11]|uniref:hypothetical protein n=1 Tax=Solimonas sp. SE-A11 TaxID=3054954 RepID=UPI00259D17FD|nr:hypothetical protein [Solimonas sp. SE-A11]MDM4771831.1 hypothetical protein [Solimonas sp. SE-A11]
MKIYKIELEVDRFKSLLPQDDSVNDRRLLALDGSSKKAEWTTPIAAEFDNDKALVPQIFSFGAGNLLIWSESRKLLGPRLEAYCELLPVFWGGGDGALVNVLGLSPCLDEKESTWLVHQGSGKRLFIEQYSFIKEAVPRRLLFKIEAQPFGIFCADHEDGSENLLGLVREHRLFGLAFKQVWQG